MSASLIVERRPRRIYWHRFMGTPKPPRSWNVGRPSVYGNEFKLKDCDCRFHPGGGGSHTREEAVQLFRDWQVPDLLKRPNGIVELRGYDLICPGCHPDEKPCHADVLLELANR